MDNRLKNKIRRKQKRTLRNRKRVRGTLEKPRLCVVKTNQHVYVQLIDDVNHQTLASVSTLHKEWRDTDNNRKNKESAKNLGQHIAKAALEKEIKNVVFDRGPNKFHGVVAAVADGAKEGGLVL